MEVREGGALPIVQVDGAEAAGRVGRLERLKRAFERAEGGLQPAVGGEDAAVQFEHELAGDDGQILFHLREALEEGLDVAPLHARHAGEIGDAAGALEHLLGGAAAAVAVAGGDEHLGMHARLLVVERAFAQAFHVHPLVVVVDQYDMGGDLGAVRALPAEAGVGEAVDRAPGELRGEEALHADGAEELRHAAAVAEDVGQPEDLGGRAAEFFELVLADAQAAQDRLAAGHLRVAFDVGGAGGVPFFLGDERLHLREQLGRAAAHGLVAGGLRVAEAEFRILAQEARLGGPGVHGLGLADALGPEPHEVDVGVAGEHGLDGVGRGLVVGVDFFQLRGEGREAVAVVEVDGAVETFAEAAEKRAGAKGRLAVANGIGEGLG